MIVEAVAMAVTAATVATVEVEAAEMATRWAGHADDGVARGRAHSMNSLSCVVEVTVMELTIISAPSVVDQTTTSARLAINESAYDVSRDLISSHDTVSSVWWRPRSISGDIGPLMVDASDSLMITLSLSGFQQSASTPA